MGKRKFEYYCDNIEDVENYEQAKADNFKGWCCHHRLELVATGGVCDVYKQDLIDWNLYWHRPSDELIFLTRKEHALLHKPTKGKKFSEEHNKKLSEAMKGKNLGPRSDEIKRKISEAIKGRQPSEDTKDKISESLKGHHHSEETRKKMSEAWKGKPKLYLKDKHWKLVDCKRVWY